MSLDEQLRAALNEEAEMHHAPPPDVDRLIRGGRVRRRRRNMTRFGVAAALVAVLVGGVVYGVLQIDRGAALEPSRPPTTTIPPTLSTDGGDASPGTYRMLVGADDTGAQIDADLTLDGARWNTGNFPVVLKNAYGGVGVYRPDALASGSGCTDSGAFMIPAKTSQDLAQQLAQLPRSTLLQTPTPVQAFGHDALHLRLRIDTQCPVGKVYIVAETPRGSRGITYPGRANIQVVIDFWVVDLNGTPVVVDTWHQDDPYSRPGERTTARSRKSITFVTIE